VLGALFALGVIGLAVKAGAELGLLEAKAALGTEVRLTPNVRGFRHVIIEGGEMPEPELIPEELASSLASSPYVVDTDRRVIAAAESPDLEMVELETASEPDRLLPFPGAGRRGFFIGSFQTGFRVTGLTRPDGILEEAQGVAELVAGRLFTREEAESGAPVAVIDELLAEKNGLEPGDTFTLTGEDGERSVELTVVGVTSEPTPTELSGAASVRLVLLGGANNIYVPCAVAQELGGQEGLLTSVTYYLDAPEHVDAFREEATAKGLDTEKFLLAANDLRYEMASAPFEALGGFARAGIIAVAVTGALVVALLVTLVTRERKLEIGILRALGAGRRAVAGQFVVETLTVCLVALLVGGLVGGLVAQDTAQALLEKEMASLHSGRLGRAAVLPGGVSFIQGPPPAGDQATPEIRVVFGWREVAAVLGLGLVLALSGSAASVWWSMRVEPMSILTSRT